METFPAFFPLAGQRIVIAGDNEGAKAKAALFEGSPAEVIRVPEAAAGDPRVYDGAALIFVASWDAQVIKNATAAARTHAAPLNVVDHPELSDFHTPAIIDRGQVVAAIGTAGTAPLMASLMRAEIEIQVPQSAGLIARLLGERREPLREAFPDLPARRAFLRAILAGPVAEAVDAGDIALAGLKLDEAIARGWAAVGRVTFITAPAQADLLSLRAVRALNIADIVAADASADDIVANHARRDAERWRMEEATGPVLVERAQAGRLVAVATATLPHDLAAAVEASGIAVARLRSAPPS